MDRNKVLMSAQAMAPDDPRLYAIRRDISLGVNNRQHGSVIKDNQVALLYNADINIPGQSRKRPGNTSAEDLGDANAGTGAYGFEPTGGTNELLVTHGAKLEGYTGSGTFAEHKTDFTTNLQTQIFKVFKSGGDGDVAVVQNGTDNAFEMQQDHTMVDLGATTGTGSDSPPKSTANAFFRGRWWVQKANKLYFSVAYPSDYSTAFDDVTDWYSIPVGDEKAIVPIRNTGLIVLGSDSIYGLNPSVTPAATDAADKILDIGCVAGKTAIQVADDVFFLASDGVRALFRTQQDKIQLGQSFPLSYSLKDEFDTINWAQISKACAVHFDGKYFIALPTSSSTYNNQVWVFYTALQSWSVITGWNVGVWAVVTFNGQDKLYYIDALEDVVYQAWTGYSDNGTAINYQEEGRKEDFQQPLQYKVGGEVEVVAKATGNYDIVVSIRLDDNDYQTLGTLNITGNAPVLPITSLPFTLAESDKIYGKWHLDSLGKFRQAQLKIQHNDTNGTDDVVVYERSIITNLEEYEGE